MDRVQAKRKRRRRRRILATFFTAFFAVLFVVLFVVLIVFLMKNKKSPVTGTWEYKIDCSDYIKLSTDAFTEDKRDMDYSFTPIPVILTLRDDGTYSIAADESGYRACVNDAYAYLEKRFSAIVCDELILAGYTGEEDVGNVSAALVNETVGGSLGEYLADNGIYIVPAFEELSSHDTEGTYKYDSRNKTVKFTDAAGKVTECKVNITDECLVFLDDYDGTQSSGVSISVESNVNNTDGNDEILYPVTFKRIQNN